MIVKLFYLPIMLNFLIGNYNSFFGKIKNIADLTNLEAITYSGYALMLSFIFLVDVAFFAFGYMLRRVF
ncbi:MAG: hypothetical protein B6U87_01555 [Candidatus Aenigmarchaeota archaeon ex4484_52]|nr:MAG: hypothetical protein B6U87_01555 [Candidatus Aenigmarchaeota archaeon ex4484_52]